jgi:hypothetical protein
MLGGYSGRMYTSQSIIQLRTKLLKRCYNKYRKAAVIVNSVIYKA